MAASDVFPPHNLNTEAVPWAREMERSARSNAYSLEDLRLSLQGENRAVSGQMGVVGRNIEGISAQVTELGSRGSGSVTGSNVSVAGSSTTAFATSTGTILVPGESGGTRQNIISFVSGVSFSSSSIQTSVFVTVFQGSNILVTARYNNSVTFPAAWTNQIQGTFVFPVAPAGTTFSVRLQTVNFNSGTQTTTLTSPTLSYVRADKV